MRIATWNVNSLKARLEKVEWWLERAAPDVLLMQETKLTDDDAPVMPFAMPGYELVHHGEGRWNGVAIASRVGDRRTSSRTSATGRSAQLRAGRHRSGRGRLRPVRRGADGERRLSAASASSASTRRTGGSSARRSTRASCAGSSGWRAGCAETRIRATPLVIGGDFNVAPTDEDVWDAAAVHGGTHVSEPERAAFRALLDWGLVDT